MYIFGMFQWPICVRLSFRIWKTQFACQVSLKKKIWRHIFFCFACLVLTPWDITPKSSLVKSIWKHFISSKGRALRHLGSNIKTGFGGSYHLKGSLLLVDTGRSAMDACFHKNFIHCLLDTLILKWSIIPRARGIIWKQQMPCKRDNLSQAPPLECFLHIRCAMKTLA